MFIPAAESHQPLFKPRERPVWSTVKVALTAVLFAWIALALAVSWWWLFMVDIAPVDPWDQPKTNPFSIEESK